MKASNQISIGSTVWVFDQNRRVYARDAKGHATGAPIWREHWVPQKVVGENRMSWITDHRMKVPKRGGAGFALSAEELEDACWEHEHRYKILRKLEISEHHARPSDSAEWLRKVAKFCNYEG